VLNGVLNNLILALHTAVVGCLVNFENHEFEIKKMDSSSSKKVIFHLFTNYLTLLLLTFEKDIEFELLSNQATSIMATSSVVNMIRVSNHLKTKVHSNAYACLEIQNLAIKQNP
jgi:hypothetical protein